MKWERLSEADLVPLLTSLLAKDQAGTLTAFAKIVAALGGGPALDIVAALIQVVTLAAKDQTEPFLAAGEQIDAQRALAAEVRRQLEPCIDQVLAELKTFRPPSVSLPQLTSHSPVDQPRQRAASRYNVGTLPRDHATYVQREADRRLHRCVTPTGNPPRASFVFLYGASGSGKSSMSLRVTRPASKSAFLSLDRFQRDHRSIIYRELGALCGLPSANDTGQIVEASRRHPSLLVLDEFGYPTEGECTNIMQMLSTLAEANLAIVACAIEKPSAPRARWTEMWTLIDLDEERFDASAVHHLLSFLPARHRDLMIGYTDGILTATRGVPERIQRLCMRVECMSNPSGSEIEQMLEAASVQN